MLAVQEESLSDGTDADGQGEVPQTVLQVLTLQTSSQVRCVSVCTNVCVCVCVFVYVCVKSIKWHFIKLKKKLQINCILTLIHSI